MAKWVWAASVVVHTSGMLVLGRLHTPEAEPPPVPIEIVEAPPAETPKEPDPPPPTEAPIEARAATTPKAAPLPGAAPKTATPSHPGARGDAPPVDLGLELGGGGGDGIAVGKGGGGGDAPAAGGAARGPAPVTRKAEAPPPCDDPPVKARPNVPTPAYPAAAIEARVSGKVRVEVTVDASGKVLSARVVSGLGHGLDEAALAAVRRGSYQPGTKCGQPATTTVVVGIRFDPP